MAISTETLGKLVIQIVGETSDAERALDKIKAKVQQVSQSSQTSLHQFMTATSQVGVGFTSLGRLATRAGSAINQNVTLPLVGAGTAAALTAIQFLELKEKTLISFETLLGSAEKAEKYMKELYEYAKTTPFSQETFYTAAQNLLAMGFSAEEAKTNLEAFTNAAIATGRGQEGIDTLTHAFGKMNAAGKVSLEGLNMITDMGVPAVKILANQLGVTTEEFFQMTRAGEVLAEDALPLLVEGMQNGTDGANGMTAAYGELAGKMKSGTLTGALDSLHSAWRNFSVELFNAEEAFPGIIKLVEAVTRVVKNLGPVFGSVTDSTVPFIDRLTELANKFADWLETADTNELRKLGDALLGVAKAGPILLVLGGALKMVGSAFRAVSGVAKIAESMATVGQSFGTVKTAVSGLGTKLGGVVKSFLAFVNPINLVKGAIGTVTGKFNLLRSAAVLCGGGFKGLATALGGGLLSSIGGVVSAIGGFIAAAAPVVLVIAAISAVVIALKEHWDQIVQVFQGFVERINLEEKFQSIQDALSRLAQALGGEGGSAFESLYQILQKVGEVILAVVTPAVGFLAGVFDGLISAIPGIIDAFTGVIEIISGIFDLIVAIFQGDGEAIKQAWDQIWQGVKDVVAGLWDSISGFFSGLVEGVIAFFEELFDVLVGHSIVPDMVDEIVDWFSQLPSRVGEAVSNLVQSVIQFFQNLKDRVVEKVSSLYHTAVNKFENLKESAKNKVSNLVQSVIQFFQNLKNNASNTVSNMVQSVVNFFSNLKSRASNTVSNMVSSVKNFFSNMKNNASNTVSNLVSSVVNFFSNLKGRVSSTVSNMVSTVIGKIQELPGRIQSAVSGAGSWLVNAGRRVVQGFIDGVSGMFSSVASKFSELTNLIPDWKGPADVDAKLLTGNGELIMQSLVDGFDKGIPKVRETLSSLTSDMADIMSVDDLSATSVMTSNVNVNSDSSVVASMNQMVSLMRQMVENSNPNYQVVLDSGVLAGAMTSDIDKNLGRVNLRRSKGL